MQEGRKLESVAEISRESHSLPYCRRHRDVGGLRRQLRGKVQLGRGVNAGLVVGPPERGRRRPRLDSLSSRTLHLGLRSVNEGTRNLLESFGTLCRGRRRGVAG